MIEPLTSAQFKLFVRQLRDHQRAITSPCPDCGGEPWDIAEKTRICPLCKHYWFSPSYGDEGRDLCRVIKDDLENEPATTWQGPGVVIDL